MVDPLSDEEIIEVRKMLARRTLFFRAMIGAIGAGIGGALIAALLN